jgi:hypothetical protein
MEINEMRVAMINLALLALPCGTTSFVLLVRGWDIAFAHDTSS